MFRPAKTALLASLLILVPAALGADIEIDQTCATCSVRGIDSTNVHHRRAIRVNQVGYLPGKPGKTAFAAVPDGGPFSVLDQAGNTVFTGVLRKAGDFPKPRTLATGYSDAITREYQFKSDSGKTEALYRADFNGLNAPGSYRIAAAGDTSASFLIHPDIYAKTLSKVLFYFGANRCGPNDSWIHGACHLKDGSALGAGFAGRLAGGWHDCGGHAKYSMTTAYAALVLSLAYTLWPERAPDVQGASHAIAIPDGIPDLLREAKVGADFIYRLYEVSEELGLLASGDMVHSVGMGPGMDHQYWDLPEKQDEAPQNFGGPDRPVAGKIGSNVAGPYAAVLAFFSAAWKKRDTAYSSKLERAAIDIYDRIVMKRLNSKTIMPCCYSGFGETYDEESMAALALWYATGDRRFGYDLLENTAIRKDTMTFNDGSFPSGHMARRFFGRTGWPSDYENIQSFVLYGLAKLILPDTVTAARYGIPVVVRDSLLEDIHAGLRLTILESSSGANSTKFPGIKVDEPYHGVFTGVQWGFNRYNLGLVNDLFMYHDLTGMADYAEVGIDNLNYLLGANPFDISFINGCGDRNLQHPHHRAANPEGYNQGGTPYARKVLTGAVLGGAGPATDLKDEWQDYTNSETCIDFAAQVIFPLLLLSRDESGVTSLPGPGQGRRISAKGSGAGSRKDARDALGRRVRGARESGVNPAPPRRATWK